MTTIVAVRHGETTWNREGLMQGWAPAPLTELGQAQANQVGAVLADEYDIDRILSSDLHRTKEMTELVLEYLEAPVTFESAWREHDIGVYQGLPKDEMFERFPEYGLWEVGPEAAHEKPDSGESLVDVRERVIERWEDLLSDCGSDETILIVAHGGPIRLILGHVKGLEIAAAIMDQSQANCAVNELQYDPETGETEVIRENDTEHTTDE